MVSPAEQSIVRRASAITVELEILEKKFALKGGASADDLDLYVRASGRLRRLLESIGIRRDPTRSRDVRPLNEILAKLDSEATAAAEGEAAE